MSKDEGISLKVAAVKASSRKARSDPRGRQREATRNKIINAAKVQFKSKRFHYTTVDDIVSYANISRATFYTYFRAKEEILLEIIITKYKAFHDRFHTLIALDRIDHDSLVAWLLEQLEEYVEHKDWLFSYYVVCDIYDDMVNFFTEGRDTALEIMGRRFTIFEAAPGEPLSDEIRSRGHMMLYEMEQFALHAAFPGWTINIRTFCSALAASMLTLINEGEVREPIRHVSVQKNRHMS